MAQLWALDLNLKSGIPDFEQSHRAVAGTFFAREVGWKPIAQRRFLEQIAEQGATSLSGEKVKNSAFELKTKSGTCFKKARQISKFQPSSTTAL